MYIDGHERKDVVQARIVFYNKMSELMQRNDVIFIAQDESIYYAKDGLAQTWYNNASLKKKGKKKEIMISGWFDHEGPMEQIGTKSLYSLKFECKWGYYTYEKFEQDVFSAIEIAEAKYPGKHLVFLYDQSSVHKKRRNNSLDAKKLNFKPGGKQPKMHETIWNGVVQSLVFPDNHPTYPGQPKRAMMIAAEQGFNTSRKKKDEVVEWLS